MKALLISPHLDDAVLSAGRFLAGNPDSTVVTIFAGIPKNKELLTDYDGKMGFSSSTEAMKIRRAEDIAALYVLDAKAVHLNYYDEQYARDEPTYAVALNSLIKLAEDCDVVLGPLGIRHPDHVRTRRIVDALAVSVEVPIYLWADLPYRVTDPGSAWEIAGKLKKVELLQGDAKYKLQACRKYSSQWDQYDIIENNVMVAEEFWRLV